MDFWFIKYIFTTADIKCIGLLQVTAKPITSMAEFEVHMMHMISQEGPLGNMMASGDAHSATQLIGALSSLLDSLASNVSSSPNQEEIEELESINMEKMTPEEIQEIEKKINDLREADRIQKENETQIRVKVWTYYHYIKM